MLKNKSNLHFPLLGRYKSCFFLLSAELTGLLIIPEGPLVLMVKSTRRPRGWAGSCGQDPASLRSLGYVPGSSLQPCGEARGEGLLASPSRDAESQLLPCSPDVASLTT